MAHTTIKIFNNKSARSVIIYNPETKSDCFLIPPNGSHSKDVWISQHSDKPLALATQKGVVRIWDNDWKIKGRWEDSPNEITFLDGGGAGVGGNVKIDIAPYGDITLEKG